MSFNTGVFISKSAITIAGLCAAATLVTAQAAEDGVLRTCLAQDSSAELCICASLVLHARLGDQKYARFAEISDRIAAIDAGAEAEEGELAGLTREGYQYFVPHGQAMAVCRDKFAAGE